MIKNSDLNQADLNRPTLSVSALFAGVSGGSLRRWPKKRIPLQNISNFLSLKSMAKILISNWKT